MALISPGVEVSIIDESFFVPAQAPTVPLIFVATADEKVQPDGETPAAGTYEHGVVRTVTSLNQSVELYGTPRFLANASGQQQHGDARNEYGLLALNQFLGIGNLAYVVRANVNLNDDIDDIRTIWDRKMEEAALVLESNVVDFITEFNEVNNLVPANPNFKVTVTKDEFLSLAQEATETVFESFSFRNSEENFYTDNTTPTTATAGFQVVNMEGSINVGQQPIDFNQTIDAASQVVNIGGVAVLGSEPTGLPDTLANQSETNYDGVGANGTFVGGDGAGGTAHTVGDIITLTSGAELEVDAVDANGDVTAFTILNGGTAVVAGDLITQLSSTGTGTAFTLTPGTANLSGVATYDVRVAVNGAGLATYTINATAAQTYNDLVAALDSAIGPATVELLNGNVRFISNTPGLASAISVQEGPGLGAAEPLFANLTDFVNIDSSTKGASNPTGLPDTSTNFTLSVAIDGGAPQLVSTQGQNAQTFGELLTQLNNVLVGGSIEISGGDLLVKSDTSDATTSSVTVVDVSLLASLVGFNSIGLATVGGANPTGLANDPTVYEASVTVDGLPYAVQVTGSTAQDFASLIAQINIDLSPVAQAAIGDGTTPVNGVVIPNGQIGIVSLSTGLTSSVVISDSDLFGSLNGFQSLETPVNGLPSNMSLQVFGDGYDQPSTGIYLGLEGIASEWVTNSLGSVVAGEWTAEEASATLLAAADDYKFTVEFLNETSLGANDAARRVAITTALQAEINSNTEVRSENFEYNLILAPGYPEVVDELLALSQDIDDEAFVIADTPVNQNPDDTVLWASTTQRFSGPGVAYYYPWALASNIDGTNVVAAPSGVALRTYAFSDDVSELWFAPAGTRRGLVSNIAGLGYVRGTLGTATTFVSANLNQGQRDNLYKDFTNINPIAFFPGRGFVVWGQKTSSPDLSARNRVNVERLVRFIKRSLRKSLLSFVFEPNDTLTRDNVKALVDNFLGDLVVRRGLFDYATIVDESNNTPARIDRNELWVDVAIKPTRAAEFIFVPIRIVATDAEI